MFEILAIISIIYGIKKCKEAEKEYENFKNSVRDRMEQGEKFWENFYNLRK